MRCWGCEKSHLQFNTKIKKRRPKKGEMRLILVVEEWLKVSGVASWLKIKHFFMLFVFLVEFQQNLNLFLAFNDWIERFIVNLNENLQHFVEVLCQFVYRSLNSWWNSEKYSKYCNLPKSSLQNKLNKIYKHWLITIIIKPIKT